MTGTGNEFMLNSKLQRERIGEALFVGRLLEEDEK
jgi:hypothetical protein